MHFPILHITMEGFVKVKTIIDAFNLSFWNFSNNGTCKLCIMSILRFNVQRETTWMIGVMILENSFVGLLTLHLTQFTTGGCYRNSLITWFLGGWRLTSKKFMILKSKTEFEQVLGVEFHVKDTSELIELITNF